MGLEERGASGQREAEDQDRPVFVCFQLVSRCRNAKTRRTVGIERRLKGELATEIRWEDATLEEGKKGLHISPSCLHSG